MPFVPDEEEAPSGFQPDTTREAVSGIRAPRRHARRTVLTEREIQSGRAEDIPSEDLGEIPEGPRPSMGAPDPEMKAPTSGPTAAQAREWQRRDLASTSPLWDAIAPGEHGIRRTAERVSRLWEQPSSGAAAGLGAAQGTAGGLLDEIGGVLGSANPEAAFDPDPETRSPGIERSVAAARRGFDAAREEAPEMYDVGEQVGGLTAFVAPTLGGPVRTGAAYGAAAGIGQGNPESLDEVAAMGLAGGALGGTAGLGARALGAVADPARLRAAAASLRQSAATQAERGAQARLEASGFWGRRAHDAIDQAGGPEAVAADLRRYRVGQSGGEMIPRSERAARDLDSMRREGGATMGMITRHADEMGAEVATAPVVARAEEVAQQLRGSGSATAGRAAQRILEEVEPLRQRETMTTSEAHRLRRIYDQLADYSGDDQMMLTAGAQFRAVRGALDREMDRAFEGVGYRGAWDEANRLSQLGIMSDRVGEGHRRLSVGGGTGGAHGSGDVIAHAIESGHPVQAALAVPGTMAARAMGQETRMAFPGAAAVARETAAGGMQALASRLMRMAQTRPQDMGRLAGDLLEAAGRGSAAILSTIYVRAQTDPEARRVLQEAQQEPEQ